MPETHFNVIQDGPVLRGTFERDDGLSSFSEALLTQIDQFCARVESDHEIRAAIITSSGRVFSLGTDLGQLERGFNDFHCMRRYLTAFNSTMNRIECLPVPVVAAVNGMARAGGLEIMLACDLSVIADGATIGDAHSAQHAVPAGGSTQRLPRRIGTQRAKELTWSGRFLTASEAVAWGLCYAAVPPGELQNTAESLVASFIDKPRPCLAAIKSMIDRSDSMSMADGVELEINVFLNYVQNYPYVKEAFTKFRDGRAQRRRL